MSEKKFCVDMSGVAEVYNLIIDVTTRYNMAGKISLPRIVVVGTEVSLIFAQLNITFKSSVHRQDFVDQSYR